MSLQHSQAQVESMVHELETADFIRETFPLMSRLCAEMGRLKGQLGQVKTPREKQALLALMGRISNSLLQGIPEQFLIKGIERERDAITRTLEATE
jgi:hypothetical protein